MMAIIIFFLISTKYNMSSVDYINYSSKFVEREDWGDISLYNFRIGNIISQTLPFCCLTSCRNRRTDSAEITEYRLSFFIASSRHTWSIYSFTKRVTPRVSSAQILVWKAVIHIHICNISITRNIWDLIHKYHLLSWIRFLYFWE